MKHYWKIKDILEMLYQFMGASVVMWFAIINFLNDVPFALFPRGVLMFGYLILIIRGGIANYKQN